MIKLEQQALIARLSEVKDGLKFLSQDQLAGPEAQKLLDELRGILAALQAGNLQSSHLVNLNTFVVQQKELDISKRQLLLDLLERVVFDPSDSGKGLPESPLDSDTINTQEKMSEQSAEVVGFNTSEMVSFYLQEATEQLEKWSDGLLELEKDGAQTDLVNELFRHAHTLKGSSGTMGYSSIVKITHMAEDVLDNLRQGKCSVSSELIDLLLDVTDRVKTLIGDVQAGGTGNGDVADLVVRLESFLSGEQAASAVSNEGEAVTTSNFELDASDWVSLRESLQTGLKIFEISIGFTPEVLMPSVRAVMAVGRLETHGKVIKTYPASDDLNPDNMNEFKILLATDQDNTVVEETVLRVSEINSVNVREFSVTVNETEADAKTNVTNSKESVQQAITSGTVSSDSKVVAAADTKAFKNQTIRVPAERLDDLLNLVGEMVIARTRMVSVGAELKKEQPQDLNVNVVNETTVYLGRLMNELQESVMAMRMVPIGQVFSRFPRLVRDLGRKTGKEIELVVVGEETELDKTIIEEIGDPLMHIVRNSVDHGIELPADRKAAGKPEKGTVTLEAYHEGSHIVIAVSDDGKGIDLSRVKEKALAKGFIKPDDELNDKELANLIFLPGLSTANQITDISGRGVGMDVVKKSLVNLGGLIDIVTKPGEGTTLQIRLPLTLAIIQALMVGVREETYAVPLASVLETLLVTKEEIKLIGGQPMIQLRGDTLSLISLQEHLGLQMGENQEDAIYVVVVGFGEKRLGLMVDELKGQQEVVIKSLGDLLGNVPGFSGATIGGDGKVTLILDVSSLVNDKFSSIGTRGSR